jgi:hypothetical protein
MRKTMRWISISLVVAIMGALFLSSPPAVLAQRFRGGVVSVEAVPVYGPFFPYAYPYPYGYYAARNYGYVKVNTHGQNADVYVDGGYAAKTPQNQEACATTRHPRYRVARFWWPHILPGTRCGNGWPNHQSRRA